MALFVNKNKKLYLIDNKNNKVLATYNLSNNNTFSIEFVHSVNKSPVIDFYTYDKDNNIILYKTEFFNFGAGIPTELENNEYISYGDNGEIIINNINKIIKPLIYVVGTVYDHKLFVDNKIINLNDQFGKNKHIKFIVK